MPPAETEKSRTIWQRPSLSHVTKHALQINVCVCFWNVETDRQYFELQRNERCPKKIVWKVSKRSGKCPSLTRTVSPIRVYNDRPRPFSRLVPFTGSEMFAMEFESSTPLRGSVLSELSSTSPFAVMCRFTSTRPSSLLALSPPTGGWI